MSSGNSERKTPALTSVAPYDYLDTPSYQLRGTLPDVHFDTASGICNVYTSASAIVGAFMMMELSQTSLDGLTNAVTECLNDVDSEERDYIRSNSNCSGSLRLKMAENAQKHLDTLVAKARLSAANHKKYLQSQRAYWSSVDTESEVKFDDRTYKVKLWPVSFGDHSLIPAVSQITRAPFVSADSDLENTEPSPGKATIKYFASPNIQLGSGSVIEPGIVRRSLQSRLAEVLAGTPQVLATSDVTSVSAESLKRDKALILTNCSNIYSYLVQDDLRSDLELVPSHRLGGADGDLTKSTAIIQENQNVKLMVLMSPGAARDRED